jgi:hypothetical protein
MGFETTISAGKRPQTYAFDRAATGTGTYDITPTKYTKSDDCFQSGVTLVVWFFHN